MTPSPAQPGCASKRRTCQRSFSCLSMGLWFVRVVNRKPAKHEKNGGKSEPAVLVRARVPASCLFLNPRFFLPRFKYYPDMPRISGRLEICFILQLKGVWPFCLYCCIWPECRMSSYLNIYSFSKPNKSFCY